MDEIRLLTVGDVHLRDSAPGKRTDTYREDIMAKCRECVEIARRENATHMLFLGDLFDDKRASRVSHYLSNAIAALLDKAGMPVLVLLGNHDLQNDSLESLPKQPIFPVGLSPNVTLMAWDRVELAPDVAIYPIPGVSLGDDWQEKFVTGGTETRRILAVHQLIVPDVTQFPEVARGNFYDAKDVAAVTDANVLLYGDVHHNHGTTKHTNRDGDPVVFSNRGAICRMTVGDVDHKPEVIMYKFTGDAERSMSAEVFPLTYRPAADVYRLEEHYEQKQHQQDIDDTIRQLKSTRVHKFSIETVVDEIRTNSTADEAVRDTAVELIELVR